MKRFSAREFALLCLPVAVVAGAGFWAARRPVSSSIQLLEAKSYVRSPTAVGQKSRIVAQLKLNELPDDNSVINWKLGLRVSAGNHLLWDENGNYERNIWLSSQNFSGVWRSWAGDFDLQSVPAQWGAVTLDWDAQLSHERQFWFRSWTENTRRNGTIVLRRVGETLSAAPIVRDSHLKLVKRRITALPASGGGRNCQMVLTFERDNFALNREIGAIEATLELRDRAGKFINSSESFESIEGKSREQLRHFEVVTYLGPPNSIKAKIARWTLQHGDYWQLQGSMIVADDKGHALLGEKKY